MVVDIHEVNVPYLLDFVYGWLKAVIKNKGRYSKWTIYVLKPLL